MPWYIKQVDNPLKEDGITFSFKVNKWWVRLKYIELFFKKIYHESVQ